MKLWLMIARGELSFELVTLFLFVSCGQALIPRCLDEQGSTVLSNV